VGEEDDGTVVQVFDGRWAVVLDEADVVPVQWDRFHIAVFGFFELAEHPCAFCFNRFPCGIDACSGSLKGGDQFLWRKRQRGQHVFPRQLVFRVENASASPCWRRFDALEGEEVALVDGERILVAGRSLGIDESGGLRVQTADGLRVVHSGEVSLRPLAALRGS